MMMTPRSASVLPLSVMQSTSSIGSRVSSAMSSHDSAHRYLCCDMNPVSVEGRRNRVLQLVIIPSIPAAILVIITFVQVLIQSSNIATLNQVQNSVQDVEQVAEFITALQDERNHFVAYQFLKNASLNTSEFIDMIPIFRNTSQQAKNAKKEDILTDLEIAKIRDTYLNTIVAPSIVIEYYTNISSIVLPEILYFAVESDNINMVQLIYVFKNLFMFQKEARTLDELIMTYLANGLLTQKQFLQFIRLRTTAQERIDDMASYNPTFEEKLERFEIEHSSTMNTIEDKIDTAEKNVKHDSDPLAIGLWMGNFSIYLSLIDDIWHEIQQDIETEVKDSTITSVLTITGYLAVFIILIPIEMFIYDNAKNTSNSLYALFSVFGSRVSELKAEKHKAEAILYQMLPKSIAKKLRQGVELPAELYEMASILFSDIEGFNIISSQSEPLDIVTFLNNVYNLIDNVIECYDAYKVETVGSTYMVVSGLPIRNGSQHAKEVANLAIDMIDSTKDFVIPHLPGLPLQLRIGIHSGPVVAGVVGNKMTRYCLFGDTVNTASRMMSNGKVSCIHISSSTNDILEKHDGYILESRGTIIVKGKGEMNTFWLKGRKALDIRTTVRSSVRMTLPKPDAN